MPPLVYVKKYNAAKLEATPGTAETLANGDAAENFYNPTFEPDVGAFVREGQLSASKISSVPAQRSARSSVETHLYSNGTGGTPFWASVLLPTAGFTQSGAGVFTPITGALVTATMQLNIQLNTYTVAGAQCNLKISADKTGEPVKMTWEHIGLYVNPGTLTMLTPTFPTVTPLRFAGATITLDSVTNFVVRKFSVDIGNKVVIREGSIPDAGVVGTIITDREVKWMITLEAPQTSTYDVFAKQRNATEFALSIPLIQYNSSGVAIGTITLTSTKAQIRTAPKLNNIDGLLCYDLEIGANRVTAAGDDEFSITVAP